MKVKCFVCGKDLNVDVDLNCSDLRIYTCSNDCSDILRLLREKLESCGNLAEVLRYLTKHIKPYKAKELLNCYIAYALAVELLSLKGFDGGILKEVRRKDVYTYEVVFYRLKDLAEVVMPITILF